jgi:two-component system response regulator MtrA
MQDTVDGFRTLLVLDDDASRMALVRQFAARRGLRTIEMGGSPQSHPELPVRSLDLVVLDADAPGGRSTCVRLRTRNVRAPIILLVNDRHDLNARLLIDAGADDMISKPVDAGVLAGRLDAHLDRDVRRVVATDLLRSADLTLDLLERRLFEGGSELPLTAVEFDVLAVLASRPGQVMSSRELLRQVWAYQQDEDPELVTALVERLQRVVEDDLARPRLVQVIAGLGYRFNG